MKLNKLMAFTMAAAMVVTGPAAAFAASTGNAKVEYASASGINFWNVQLPTTPKNEDYSFRLDPNSLLSKYDKSIAKGTLYFTSETKAASITGNKDATGTYAGNDGKVYLQSKTASTATKLAEALTIASKAVSAVPSGYYLWVPKQDGTADGKYAEIVKDGATAGDDSVNLLDYFDITYTSDTTATLAIKDNYSSTTYAANATKFTGVCDGKVYTDSYTAINAKADLSDYITYDASNNKVTGVTGLYFGVKGTDNKYTYKAVTKDGIAVAKADNSKVFTYTPATTGYTTTSKKFSIVNKSSYDLAIGVKFEVTGLKDLKLASDANLNPKDGIKAAYLSVTDGKNAVFASNEDDKVTIDGTYVVAATDTSKGVDYADSKVTKEILGHEYKTYLAPGLTYSSLDLYLTGAANPKYTEWESYLGNFADDDTTELSVVFEINTLKATVSGATVTATIPVEFTKVNSATFDGQTIATNSISADTTTKTVTYTAASDIGVGNDADYPVSHSLVITTDKGKFTFKTEIVDATGLKLDSDDYTNTYEDDDWETKTGKWAAAN